MGNEADALVAAGAIDNHDTLGGTEREVLAEGRDERVRKYGAHVAVKSSRLTSSIAPFVTEKDNRPTAGFYAALRRHNGAAPLAGFVTVLNSQDRLDK